MGHELNTRRNCEEQWFLRVQHANVSIRESYVESQVRAMHLLLLEYLSTPIDARTKQTLAQLLP